jgi:hypothetical protein
MHASRMQLTKLHANIPGALPIFTVHFPSV